MAAEKRYYVYIMASKSRVLYIGITGPLYGRVMQHKRGESDGFTKRYNVKRLVYFETFRYVNNALHAKRSSRNGAEQRKWR